MMDYNWRGVAVATLLGWTFLAAVTLAAPRSPVVADPDLIGRHPNFRWPLAAAETDPVAAPAGAGALAPVDR